MSRQGACPSVIAVLIWEMSAEHKPNRGCEMNRVFTTSLAVLLLIATEAKASDLTEAVTMFGLDGRWTSGDCGQPASASNDFDVWTLQNDGSVTEDEDAGSAYQSHYRFYHGELIGDDKIALDGVWLGNGHAQHLVIEKQGDKQRTYSNRDTTAGRDLIVDGVIQSQGKSVDWYAKCR